MMRRTTPTGTPLGESIDDATMKEFVRVLVDITVADYPAERLFADETLSDCLLLVLAKNRGLHDFGADPWPEDRLAQAARAHLNERRAAKRH